MQLRASLIVLAAAVTATNAHAYFSGPSFFSEAPGSQIGSVTNNLTITDTATGFVVSGTVSIAVAAGSHSGTLLSYTVDRPLDPAWGTGAFWTTTVLDGFCTPPGGGTYGNTFGAVRSHVTSFPTLSASQIPISLIAGAATWNNLTNSSGMFTYTSGGVNFLRQRFDLDGIQSSGTGGTWLIDVPVTTSLNAVPEPATIVAIAFGVGALLNQRRKASRA